jgi:hypothetical protein
VLGTLRRGISWRFGRPALSEPESLRNSTPEERLSFFGKG